MIGGHGRKREVGARLELGLALYLQLLPQSSHFLVLFYFYFFFFFLYRNLIFWLISQECGAVLSSDATSTVVTFGSKLRKKRSD